MLLRPFDASQDKPRSNPDGSYSTEITRTVETPEGWAVVPSLWFGGEGGPRDFGGMNDDQLSALAQRYEKASKQRFPRYKSLDEADAFATERSREGGATQAPLAGQSDAGLGDRLQNWWNSTTFFKPAYDELVGGATMFGDVMSGAQPTMAADPQTGEFHTDPRLADRAMNAAGMLTLGAGAIPAEANSLRMGIKAYHGSPHDFERFDSSKIGTGEGAQAYGHGLYLAENEGVAKSYRDNLSKGSDPRDFISEIINSLRAKIPTEAISKDTLALEMRRYDPTRTVADNDELMGHIQNAANGYDIKTDTYSPQAMASLQRLDKLLPPPKPGRMYEVDIAADPEHFLDWDKPLSEQSPQVQQAALGTSAPPDPGALRKRAETAGGAEKQFLLNQADYLENQLKMHGEGWHGSAVAENLPSEWDDFETARRIARAKVAEQLKERGAAGIRYLDQGSRVPAVTQPKRIAKLEQDILDLRKALASPPEWTKTTKGWSEKAWVDANAPRLQDMEKELDAVRKEKPGTHNYVIFPGNEHLIAVLRKYGLPISAAGLAALSQLHPQEAQAAQPLGDRLQGR
jgi:hypothetical protein